MKQVHLRFYEELNDHLPADKRKHGFDCRFVGFMTVRTIVRAVGVPISEVDLVLCEGESVDFDEVVEDGNRIAVYPVLESFELKGITRLRDEPLRRPAFVAGPGLGRLAAYLRLLGLDTCFFPDADVVCAAGWAETHNRILLTRERRPANASRVFAVRETRPRDQAAGVIRGLDLGRLLMPLGRCPRCNSVLPDSGASRRQCGHCNSEFSSGPHLRRAQRLIRYLTQSTTGE